MILFLIIGFFSQLFIAVATFLAVTALHWDACNPIKEMIAFLHSSTSSSFSA